MPVAWGTAHDCRFEFDRLKAGEKVLIQAGASGVGLACVLTQGRGVDLVVDKTLPLAQAAAAHAYSESRAAFGRVLLIP